MAEEILLNVKRKVTQSRLCLTIAPWTLTLKKPHSESQYFSADRPSNLEMDSKQRPVHRRIQERGAEGWGAILSPWAVLHTLSEFSEFTSLSAEVLPQLLLQYGLGQDLVVEHNHCSSPGLQWSGVYPASWRSGRRCTDGTCAEQSKGLQPQPPPTLTPYPHPSPNHPWACTQRCDCSLCRHTC